MALTFQLMEVCLNQCKNYSKITVLLEGLNGESIKLPDASINSNLILISPFGNPSI